MLVSIFIHSKCYNDQLGVLTLKYNWKLMFRDGKSGGTWAHWLQKDGEDEGKAFTHNLSLNYDVFLLDELS